MKTFVLQLRWNVLIYPWFVFLQLIWISCFSLYSYLITGQFLTEPIAMILRGFEHRDQFSLSAIFFSQNTPHSSNPLIFLRKAITQSASHFRIKRLLYTSIMRLYNIYFIMNIKCIHAWLFARDPACENILRLMNRPAMRIDFSPPSVWSRFLRLFGRS